MGYGRDGQEMVVFLHELLHLFPSVHPQAETHQCKENQQDEDQDGAENECAGHVSEGSAVDEPDEYDEREEQVEGGNGTVEHGEGLAIEGAAVDIFPYRLEKCKQFVVHSGEGW